MSVSRAFAISRVVLVALLFVVMLGCSSGENTPTDSATRLPRPEGSIGDALAAGDLNPCALLTPDRLRVIAGRRVMEHLAYRTEFVLPGMSRVPATQCGYAFEPGGPIRGVRLRVTKQAAATIFKALERFDSAGLERIGPPPSPSVEAFWQPVGRAVWLRGRTLALSVVIVTDADGAGDYDLARAIGLAALEAGE